MVTTTPIRQRVVYTDDAGRKVLIGVLKRYAEHPDLGFDRADQARIGSYIHNPSNFHPRFITMHNPQTRTRYAVLVGSLASRAWNPATTSIDLPDPRTGGLATFLVRSRTGERWD